jgi:hypothetical protein
MLQLLKFIVFCVIVVMEFLLKMALEVVLQMKKAFQ